MEAWIADVHALLTHPRTLTEVLVILVLLGVAALLARGFRQHAATGDSVHASGLRRLAFPLISVGLLLVAKLVVQQYGWPVRMFSIAIQLLLAMAAVRMVVFALRYLSNAPWIATFERSIALLIWGGMALDIVGVMPDLITWLESFSLPVGKTKITLWAVLQGLVMALATMLAALWLGGLAEGRLMAAPLDTSLKVVFSRIIKALLLVVAILLGMGMAGLDITALSVFGGALGVGIGFGMQKIASNYVSGFIILLDRSIQIGNIIQVGAERGEVQRITTRYTVLRGPSGVHYILPNETLISSVVQNDTYTDRNLRLTTRVQVGYGTDVEAVIPLLESIATEQPRVLPDPAPKAFLVSFDDSGMTLELGMWINDPENGQQDVRSDINRVILQRFREHGIEIPFPQRELRVLRKAQPASPAQ